MIAKIDPNDSSLINLVDETKSDGKEVYPVIVGDDGFAQSLEPTIEGGPGPGLLLSVMGHLRKRLTDRFGDSTTVVYSRGFMIFNTKNGLPPSFLNLGDCRTFALADAKEAFWIFILTIVQSEATGSLGNIVIKASPEEKQCISIHGENDHSIRVHV